MQICAPLDIDLICGLILIFLCGLLSFRDDTDNICFIRKSVHLSLPNNVFTFNTAVVASVGLSKLQVIQHSIIADS